MPEVGEIKIAEEISYKTTNRYIWSACLDCGKERWVRTRYNMPVCLRCYKCAGKRRSGLNNPQWKGGRQTTTKGYVFIQLDPNDFFFPMANKSGYLPEHRFIMAKSLGRCLQPWEQVHHKGIRYTGAENKSDNQRDNLELTINGSHIRQHSKGYKDGYQKGLADGRLKQIEELKQEIRLLQWQVKESVS